MKDIRIHIKKILVICLSAFIFINLASFTKANTHADIEKLLSAIKKYEYGQSKEPMTKLSEAIRSVIESPEDLKLIEKSMITFLKSDATLAGKQFICQKLSIIGTEESVSVAALSLSATALLTS